MHKKGKQKKLTDFNSYSREKKWKRNWENG